MVEKSLSKSNVKNSREASNSRYASSSKKASNIWGASNSRETFIRTCLDLITEIQYANLEALL